MLQHLLLESWLQSRFFARVLHGGEFQDFQVSGQQFEERVNSLKFVEIYDLVFNLREDLR